MSRSESNTTGHVRDALVILTYACRERKDSARQRLQSVSEALCKAATCASTEMPGAVPAIAEAFDALLRAVLCEYPGEFHERLRAARNTVRTALDATESG